MESFNLPLFCPNVDELESIVKMEKSFEIAGSVKLLSDLPLHPISEVRKGDEEMFGRMVTNNYRAAFKNVVRAQLGSDVLTDEKIGTAKSREYDTSAMELICLFPFYFVSEIAFLVLGLFYI